MCLKREVVLLRICSYIVGKYDNALIAKIIVMPISIILLKAAIRLKVSLSMTFITKQKTNKVDDMASTIITK